MSTRSAPLSGAGEPLAIDLERWERRDSWAFFRACPDPRFSITVPLALTPLLRACETRGAGIFAPLVHAISWAAQQVPELRLRTRGEGVFQHAQVHPSVTVPTSPGRYGHLKLRWDEDYPSFADQMRRGREALGEGEIEPDDPEDLGRIFLSSFPWRRLSAVQQPLLGGDLDAIPRIIWGRAWSQEGELGLDVSLQAHHGLADGLHAESFFRALQQRSAAAEDWLGP